MYARSATITLTRPTATMIPGRWSKLYSQHSGCSVTTGTLTGSGASTLSLRR